MTTVNDRLRDTAQRLISDYGRAVSLVESTTTLADPSKPWGSDGDTVSTSSYSTYGAFVSEGASDLEARLSAVSRLVLSPVEVNEAHVYVAAQGLSVVPTTAMQLQDGTRTLEIKKVQVVKPGSAAILYILTVEN